MKNQKGITLVALVITIIVLLILAGVSISLVIGNNGVLTQASSSVVTDKAASTRQALQLAAASVETYYYSQWASNTSVTRDKVGDVRGAYADSVNGLVAQLAKDGYTLGTGHGSTFTALTDAQIDTTIFSSLTITLKNTSNEYFVFSSVKIDRDTGELSYVGSPAKVTVYNASDVEQGSVNL